MCFGSPKVSLLFFACRRKKPPRIRRHEKFTSRAVVLATALCFVIVRCQGRSIRCSGCL